MEVGDGKAAFIEMHTLEIVATEAEHNRNRVLLIEPDFYGGSAHQVNLLLEGDLFVHPDCSGYGMENVKKRISVFTGFAVDKHGFYAFVNVVVGGENEHLRGDCVLLRLADEGACPQYVGNQDCFLG